MNITEEKANKIISEYKNSLLKNGGRRKIDLLSCAYDRYLGESMRSNFNETIRKKIVFDNDIFNSFFPYLFFYNGINIEDNNVSVVLSHYAEKPKFIFEFDKTGTLLNKTIRKPFWDRTFSKKSNKIVKESEVKLNFYIYEKNILLLKEGFADYSKRRPEIQLEYLKDFQGEYESYSFIDYEDFYFKRDVFAEGADLVLNYNKNKCSNCFSGDSIMHSGGLYKILNKK
jgi:hypothetical protein